MNIKILMIDDDEVICQQMKELLDGENIGSNHVELKYTVNFSDGIRNLKEEDFDLVILDLFKGRPAEDNPERPGKVVLEEIREYCFIHVIFYTGLIKPVEHLESDIVRVLRKSDGHEALKCEIKNIFDSRLPYIKKKLIEYTRETMRAYFWDFIHPNWEKFSKIKDEISLGYLIVRRLGRSLSKERIIDLLEDPKISVEKIHPMEFYIYPGLQGELETGDILKHEDKCFVILTPSCDIILWKDQRKAKNILLVECIPLENTEEYQKYRENSNAENKNNLKKLIEGRKGDRYFFLPEAPFIKNSVLDFQQLIIHDYNEVNQYLKVAGLDDPFAQSMLSYFIRYYNRIGYPDIDSDYILKKFQ